MLLIKLESRYYVSLVLAAKRRGGKEAKSNKKRRRKRKEAKMLDTNPFSVDSIGVAGFATKEQGNCRVRRVKRSSVECNRIEV